MSHFRIRCGKCGTVLREAYCAFCEHCAGSLLVTEYESERFEESGGEGIWRFNWLPVHKPGFSQSGSVIYRSSGLASELGLENLFIAFNGYWPEKGAQLMTCTFKEFEAAVVLENARDSGLEGMVVASAGNTARAFAHLSTVSGFPAIIIVPKMCLFEMWYLEASHAVPTFALEDGDYSDAIDMARRLALTQGFPFEGGVKNIAKRDGLGIVLMEAVSAIGRMPDRYFQAVGSGTGAISVWEMAGRFMRDGRFGSRAPVLHLAQNLPFAPMTRAWEKDSRELFEEDLRPELIDQITTRVISNRYPAYSVRGGVYDALRATGGRMYGIVNDEVYDSMKMFENLEGIDIVPAAGVAVAALRQAVREAHFRNDELVLLNITGGGEERLKMDQEVHRVSPVFISKNASNGELEEMLCGLLKKD